MATGSQPGEVVPPARDPEAAADIRMLYQACKADIQSSKAEEWRVTLQVYLFYGAVVTTDSFLSDDFDCWLALAAIVAGGMAVWVLFTARRFIVEQRGKLTRLSMELSPRARVYFAPKGPWHDVWFAWLLGFLIVGGLIGTLLIVFCG